MNMGDTINSPHTEYISCVTLDGKYLFFTSNKSGNRDIFWVDSGIIDELHVRLAEVYEARDDIEPAIESCKKALELKPDYGSAAELLKELEQ